MGEETDTMLQPTHAGRPGRRLQRLTQKIIELAQFFLGSAGEELEIAHGEICATGNPCRRASFAKGAEAAYGVSSDLVLPANIEQGLASTRSFDPPQQVSGHEAHLALVQGDPETGLIQVKSPSSSKTRDRRGPGPGQCSTGSRQRPVRGAAI
jgi:Molybdopterin-binding domain of aldehyde dehydrogenase